MTSDFKLRREVSSNECAVCFGLYDEDVDPDSGDMTQDWIQCTDKNCGVWTHTECLDKCDDDYVCYICGVIFCYISVLPCMVYMMFSIIKHV